MYLTFFKERKQVNRLTSTDYTLDDVFAGVEFNEPVTEILDRKSFETKTVITSTPPRNYNKDNIDKLLEKLQELTTSFTPATLANNYNTFYIPKRTGGVREINAPKEELMEALKEMKNIFQYNLKVLYHNAAYAYVPSRSIVNALKVHQKNNSRWFLKLDIKDFFPNCSQEFVVKSLRKIYPFAMWTEQELNSFIWICFRNDALPQGTPMSPMLTNLIMIPIDYALQNYAYENKLVYTRYADDILISAHNHFDWRKVIESINTVFTTLQTPFQIKAEKTRYGSSAGRNWNLGLMLNKDNNITVGYRNKKNYKAMLNNLMTAEASANFWDSPEIQHFQGVTAYYLSVEPEYFKPLIKKYEEMYNLTLKEIYKRAL
jgi:hypothetical protein